MHSGTAVSRNSWWAQALQNRLIALVLAMVVIVPLVASPADSRVAGSAALAFEGFAILLMATLLWQTRWNLSRENVITFLRTGANLPVLLFFALAVVSCALSPYKTFSVQETLKLGSGVLLYFVVAYQFRQSKHLLMLADTLIFLALAVSFIGMADYMLNTTARAQGLFGNAQPLGSLLMILLPIVAVIAFTDKGSMRPLVAQFATVITVGCLILTQTRSSWMGTIAALATMAIMMIPASAKKQGSRIQRQDDLRGYLAARKHKFVQPLMLAVVALGFVFLMGTQNRGILERANTLTKYSYDASIQGRIQNNWAGAMQMVKERPLTGWGAGLFPVYQLYYTQQGNLVAPNFKTATRVSLSEQAHNFYLQTAAELGLPGLLLMVGVLGSFLLAGLHRVGKMDAGIRRSMLMGSIAAVVAFAVDAVSSPSWQFGEMSMFLWLMLGVGVSCIRPRDKAEHTETVIAPSPLLIRPMALVTASLALMAVLSTFNVAGAITRYERQCREVCRSQENNCSRQAQINRTSCLRVNNCAAKQRAEEQACPPSGRARTQCLARARRNRQACERPCSTAFQRAKQQCARQKQVCQRSCITRTPRGNE
jgi:O-antigen ligase